MSGPNSKPVIPFSIGAGTIIQLLAGIACFLAAFALPVQIPEIEGLGQNILMGLGGFCFFVAFISVVFRDEILKCIHPHPTTSEAIMVATAGAHGEVIHI